MSKLTDIQIDLPTNARWGVAVSGGADSVALLRLVAHCLPPDALHVIHLNHETRGKESLADQEFVKQLAGELRIQATTTQLSKLLPTRPTWPANPSARYRQVRLALYKMVIREYDLDSVLLAHHADDQSETVLLRLLRGAGFRALKGMSQETSVGGISLRRPLLRVRRDALRGVLQSLRQPWREDSSNASGKYARNRVRRILMDQPALSDALMCLADACAALRDWVDTAAPTLASQFETKSLADLPRILAESAAGEWFSRQGVNPDDLSSTHIEALISLCRDASRSSRHSAPGNLSIRRRRGIVSAEASPRQ